MISLNNLPASYSDDSEKHKLISLWQLGLIQCCFNLEGNFSINAMSLRLPPFFCTSVHALHDHSRTADAAGAAGAAAKDELAVLVSDSAGEDEAAAALFGQSAANGFVSLNSPDARMKYGCRCSLPFFSVLCHCKRTSISNTAQASQVLHRIWSTRSQTKGLGAGQRTHRERRRSGSCGSCGGTCRCSRRSRCAR